MGEFASKPLAGTALGLAIPGTVALVNQLAGGNGGLLGGLFGGGNNQTLALMAENAMLKAEKSTDEKIAALYKATRDEKEAQSDRLIDKYIGPMAQQIAAMQVEEARNQERIKCLGEKTEMQFAAVYKEIECAKKECGAAIALESERRTNGDQNLMCYVNATFVPGKVIMPTDNICPPVMPQYNSWTAPTTTTT